MKTQLGAAFLWLIAWVGPALAQELSFAYISEGDANATLTAVPPAAGAWRTVVEVEADVAWAAFVAPADRLTLARRSSSRLAAGPFALDGIASFYWQGVKTASGELFDKRAMTAAHRSLPFGSRVAVTNLSNGRSVTVRINDRGPFKPGRVIDLSEGAAEVLDMQSRGLVPVKISLVKD